MIKPPKFQFYDSKTPFFTSPRFLPPTRVEKCKVFPEILTTHRSRKMQEGNVLVGVGENTKIRNCIIDMNAKIGRNVIITNADGVDEADKTKEGFYIRSGITVILKNATIKDGTVI
ncbi:unnamed protein product [Trifolium pratense]|uniref:Uncharacterized protein n=2 Tax=Trifolium pratense TaxID=57577 RepID=A0ACB0K5A8_TRIPR|nr:unnamed protein product [Trifolium pratense]